MTDQPSSEESVVSQPPYNKTDETATAIATLLTNEETARNEEPKTTTKEEEGKDDLEKDTNDPLLEDLDVEEIDENQEAKLESEEELYDITVNGNKQKVTLK